MSYADTDSSASDYEVEQYVCPDKIRKPINDDSADLLGNFDDVKRQEISNGTYIQPDVSNPSDEESVDDIRDGISTKQNEEDPAQDDELADNQPEPKRETTHLSKEQLASLMRGASKANRFVLYVTNLNFETTKGELERYFSRAGQVKNIRIPKNRRGGYAFVEMVDVEGFQNAFELHNTELGDRKIKIQISEGGKKKSANKKNILKQKNRKLAEMRNEQKFFMKSGKYYDKELKREKAKEVMARQRWRKQPAPKS